MKQPLAGYTLLELVVVMGILAMATALVAPPSYRMIRSWQEATQVDDVLQQLSRLPTQVRATGNPLYADASTPITVLTLPEGWQVHLLSPLRVQANGMCSDAEGELHTQQQVIAFQIAMPFCRVQRVTP